MKKQYMLRTCAADMTSHGGFRWPRRGPVAAPDWSPKPECGGGLHGLLSGCGDGSLLSWEPDAVWLVVRIDGEVVELGGKIKTDRGCVIYAGDRKNATDKIRSLCGDGSIVGATMTGGYGATMTGGERATMTGGDRATMTGGDRATMTGGERATMMIKWYDGNQYRIAVAYVGEDGIEAGKKYRCENGKFMEVGV